MNETQVPEQEQPDNDMSRVPEFLQSRIKALQTQEPQNIATDTSTSRNEIEVSDGEDDGELESRVEELRRKLKRAEDLEREYDEAKRERERLAAEAAELRAKLSKIESERALEITDEEKALLGGDEGLAAVQKIVDRIAQARAKEIQERVEQELAKRLGDVRVQAVEELEKRKASELRAKQDREFNERVLKAIPEWNKIARSKEFSEFLAKDIRAGAVVKEIFTNKLATDAAIEALKEVVSVATGQAVPQVKYQATPSFGMMIPSKDDGVDSVARARALARNGGARQEDVAKYLASLY